MIQEHYETAIRRAIAKHRAEAPEQRERIYAAARESLLRSDKGGEEINALDAAIKAIEDTFLKPQPIYARQWSKKFNLWSVPVFAAGLAIGLGAAYGLSNIPTDSKGMDDSVFAQRFFERTYKEQAELTPVAIAYLRKISDTIVERQRNDRNSLKPAERKFIALSAFDAQLAKNIPPSLPRGTSVIVRATSNDFKILMNWTLCGVASISNPEMVDKVRNSITTIGCPYFGTWTQGAAAW